jgi:iron(III) transport system permease protein
LRGKTITTTVNVDKPAKALKKKSGIKLDIGTKTILIISVFLLLLMVVFPLLNIFTRAFDESGKEVFSTIFTSEVVRGIIRNTIVLGVVVATLGTIIGFFLAYAQVKLNFRGKKLLHIISLVPLITPPFAFATAVISLFGRSGIITRDILGLTPTLYGLPGLTIVLTCSFFPVAYMSILGMMKNLDPALDEASASLGASKLKTFFKVTLPMLIPGFASSFLLLFVEASADLANPLVIGGDYTVLASRAYIAINGEYDVPAGSAYSLILLVPGLIVFIVQRYWGERKSVVSVTGKPTGTPTYIENRIAKFFLLIIPVSMGSFIVLIYATVIYGSFAKFLGVDNSPTLANYRYIFSGIGNDAIMKTTIMALIATPIAGLLGMVLAWLIVRKVRKGREALDFLGMLGLAVPGTVLGIGFAITFNHSTKIGETTILPQLAGGGAIFGGAVAIIMVYTIRSSPAGQRSAIAALQQINPAIDEASASLGASGFTTFRKITLPLIKPALLTGLMFAFAHSMTTLSPIIFITTPETPIMTQKILAEVDSGRFGNAFAFCTLLIFIVLTVMGLINLLVRGKPNSSSSASNTPIVRA